MYFTLFFLSLDSDFYLHVKHGNDFRYVYVIFVFAVFTKKLT